MEAAARGSGYSRATSGSDTDNDSQRPGGSGRIPAEVAHLVTQLVGYVSITAALHIVQPPRDNYRGHGVGERPHQAVGREPRESRAGADRPRRSLRSPRRLSGRFEFSPDLIIRLTMFGARIKTMRQLEMCSTSTRRRKAKNKLPHLSPRTSDCVCWKHRRDANGRPTGVGLVKQPHVLTQHSADAHLHRQRRPQVHGTGRPVVRTTSERVMTKPPLAPHDGISPRSRRQVFAATAIKPMRLVIPPPNEPGGTASASSTPRGRMLVPNKMARQTHTFTDDSSDDDFSGEPPELVISPLQRHRVIVATPAVQQDHSGAPSPAIVEPHAASHGRPNSMPIRSAGGVEADNESSTPVPTVQTVPETFASNQSTFTRTVSHVGYTVTSYSPTPIPASRLWSLPWVPRTAPHSAPNSADSSPIPTTTPDGFILVHYAARGLHNSRPVQRRQGMTGYRPHGAFRAVAVVKPPA